MVIDDDAETCALLENLFRGEGCEVATATSGRAALDLLGETTPDFILLDDLVSDTDGVATLREIRARGFEGKVVILTAAGTIKMAREAMMLGAFEYITKPFDRELLKSVFREALRDSPTTTQRGDDACAP